jgi:hypothetical protein
LKIERAIQILVRRRAALGDAIMSTGVVRELKRRYVCNIDVVTDFPDAYRNSPHIRDLFSTATAPNSAIYDLYVNLDDCYEFNPENHYLDSYWYRAFGETTGDRSVELFATDEDRTRILNIQYENNLDRYIVVHMRNWHWELKNMNLQTWFDVYAQVFEQHDDIKVVQLCDACVVVGLEDVRIRVEACGSADTRTKRRRRRGKPEADKRTVLSSRAAAKTTASSSVKFLSERFQLLPAACSARVHSATDFQNIVKP